MTSIKLSLDAILLALAMGGILSLIYLELLWYSLKLLPKIKRKGLFLFASAAIRIFLFLFLIKEGKIRRTQIKPITIHKKRPA